MNLVYITTLGTFAVRKEHQFPFYEIVELRPASTAHAWEVICGYSTLSDAIKSSEAMEKWEIFAEKTLIFSQGVPCEDLPPHRVNPMGDSVIDGSLWVPKLVE